jgi:hypothetical protein
MTREASKINRFVPPVVLLFHFTDLERRSGSGLTGFFCAATQ